MSIGSSRTGLDPIEQAALSTMLQLGCTPDAPHLKTARVLDTVAQDYGYAADDVHRRILQLSQPWVTVLRTIDFHGNVGSRTFEAASPRYTEVRLTALGLACAGAEMDAGPPLPVGLVHGDLWKGGTWPPLDPHRLIAGLRAHRSGGTADEVLALVGPPSFPAGCMVDGDVRALHAGERVRLRLRAVLEVQERRVVIRALPPEIGEAEMCARLHDLAVRHAAGSDQGLPIADVQDHSHRGGMELRVLPLPGVTSQELADLLGHVWGIEVLRDAMYSRPLAGLLSDWLGQPEAVAGLDRFEAMLAPAVGE